LAAQTGITANDVVDAYIELNNGADPNYTGASELAWLINEVYGDKFYAYEEFNKGEYWETFFARHWLPDPERQLAPQLRRWLASSQYVIAGIPIISAGSLVTDYTAGRVGRTKGSTNDRCKTTENQGGIICHWVTITGVSNQWDYAYELSPWNWIRIYNPFDNHTEYYWWPDFKDAWRIQGYGMVLLKQKLPPARPSRPGQPE
jgi:hypothetical protein